jgi:hypothetical protein
MKVQMSSGVTERALIANATDLLELLVVLDDHRDRVRVLEHVLALVG